MNKKAINAYLGGGDAPGALEAVVERGLGAVRGAVA